MQRCHHSCCRRNMNHIVADPGETTEESIDFCCSRKCRRTTSISETSAGKSTSNKVQNTSKTNYLLKKDYQENGNQRSNHRSSNRSDSDRSLGLQKNKRSCICTTCHEDSLMSGCSSSCDCGSTINVIPSKTKRNNKKIKSYKSKSEPQDADSKALMRSKRKRKKLVDKKWPTRLSESRTEGPITQESYGGDGVWFECNLPFRVNIPFPISLQNLFGLQEFPGNSNTQIYQSKTLLQAGKIGMPFCVTLRNALPDPVPKEPKEPQEPQPSTSKATSSLPKKTRLRRGKKCRCPSPCLCPSPCPCDTATQTGEKDSDPVLYCLKQIRNQLAAKSTEGQQSSQFRCFAEKSTNVRQRQEEAIEEKPEKSWEPQEQEKAIEEKPAKISKESSVTSLDRNSSNSSLHEEQKAVKTKKAQRKPKEIKSLTSTTSAQKKYLKSSAKELQKPAAKNKKTGKKTKKSKSVTSSTCVKSHSQGNLQKKATKEERQPKVEKAKKSAKARKIVKEMEPNEFKENRQWIDPEPVGMPSVCYCRRHQVFSEYPNDMIQESGYPPYFMHPTGCPQIYQQPQFPGYGYERFGPNWQSQEPQEHIFPSTEQSKNEFLRNTAPEKIIQPFSKCSASLEHLPNSLTTCAINKCFSQCSRVELQKSATNNNNTEQKPTIIAKESSATSSENYSSKSSVNKVQKAPAKTENAKQNPKRAQSTASTTSVQESFSRSSLKELQKPCTKSTTSTASRTKSSSIISIREVQNPPPKNKNPGKNPKKTLSITSTSVTSKSSSKYSQNEENTSHKELPKPNKNVKENKSKKIQIKREWIDSEPDRGTSVTFGRCPQVSPEYSSAMIQGSGYQPHYMQQYRQDCQSHEPVVEISSSTEYSNSFMKRSEANITYSEDSITSLDQELNSQTPKICRCSIDSFQLTRNKPPVSKNQRHYEEKNQRGNRFNSGEETMAVKEPQFDGVSRGRKSSYNNTFYGKRATFTKKFFSEELSYPNQGVDHIYASNKEIKSASGSILKNKSDQEYYFPLKEKNMDLDLQEKAHKSSYQSLGDLQNRTQVTICQRGRSLSEQISLSHDEVTNTRIDEYQISDEKESEVSSSESSRKITGQPQINDNFPYNQNNYIAIQSGDLISISFTNRTFSISSDGFISLSQANDQYLEENQRKSQSVRTDHNIMDSDAHQNTDCQTAKLESPPSGAQMDEDLALQYSIKSGSMSRRSGGSILTEDIDEGPSTSCKSSEKFKSKLVYSQFQRQFSRERLHANHVSVNKENIYYNSRACTSKDQSIPYLGTTPVSGMNTRPDMTRKQAKYWKHFTTANANPIFANRKRRSKSAPGCFVLQRDRNRYKKPFQYRSIARPENRFVVQDESCESELELQNGGKNCITQDCSINNAYLMEAKQRGEEWYLIKRQEQERIPAKSRYMPGYLNMQERSPRKVEYQPANYQNSRQNPPMVMVPLRMESREIINVCQPDEWRELNLRLSMVNPNKFQMPPESESNQVSGIRGNLQGGRSLPREPPLKAAFSPHNRENTMRYPHICNNNMPNTNFRNPHSYTSEEEYVPLSHHSFSRPQVEIYCQCDQSDIWSQRKPRSNASLSQSEDGYYDSFTSKNQSETDRSKTESTLVSSTPHNSSSRSDTTVEGRGRRKVARISSNDSSTRIAYKYPENIIKPDRGVVNDSKLSMSRSYCCYDCKCKPHPKGISDSGSGTQTLAPISMEQAQPECSFNQSIKTQRTTDVETLETVTLMQPRRLRSNESTITKPERGTKNTILLEISTTCEKDHLIQACGRPPSDFSRQQYAGIPPTGVPVQSQNYQQSFIRTPQNGSSFEEHYEIDPRDSCRTGPGCQQHRQIRILDPGQHFTCHNPSCCPQPIAEEIKNLPPGFYDQTIEKYNIIRMDSDFQPPPYGPEILTALEARPQYRCGCMGYPCGNPNQQHRMRPVQNSTRSFVPPQNQIHYLLPNQPMLFCSRHTVQLDGCEQSEYHI